MSEVENRERETGLVDQLHRLLKAIDATGHAVLPQSNLALLQSIVETAARILHATGSAIALVTPDGKELSFKVSYNSNKTSQDVVGLRIPINQGIAGYVAMTGQPLTVSSVDEDDRFNRSFAENVGYIPDRILAVPLLQDEEVLGVIEVLDKQDGQPFGMADIELLTIFADQAAMAIDQSNQIEQLQQALIAGLKRLAGIENGEGETAALVHALDNQPDTEHELIQLAQQIYDINALGEAEQVACRQILQAFQAYSRTKSTAHTSFGMDFGL